MRRPIVVLSVLACTSIASADEALRHLAWTKPHKAPGMTRIEVIAPGVKTPFEYLRITKPDAKSAAIALASVDEPKVTAARYAVLGKVRYSGVEPDGYLEMWSVFPDGARYFTRTLGNAGPMKSLKGSSDWREFALPFSITKTNDRPKKLVVNVVLPGPGTVEIGPMRLVQYAPGEDPMAAPGQWWDDQTGGFIGAILGVAMGCLGGLVGWLVSRGQARGFVIGTLKTMTAVGVALLALGGVALAYSQPYAVFYPLLLGGVLCAVIPGGVLRTTRKRYEEMELRKMAALDAT